MAKKIPYAIDKDSKTLFVKAKYSGINYLIAMIDGLSHVFFGRGKTPYFKVNDVIDWHVKELEITNGQAGSEEVLKHLRAAAAGFEEAVRNGEEL